MRALRLTSTCSLQGTSSPLAKHHLCGRSPDGHGWYQALSATGQVTVTSPEALLLDSHYSTSSSLAVISQFTFHLPLQREKKEGDFFFFEREQRILKTL